MFRRLPSGLPKDPIFPSDLKGLGYFVDEDKDEIRNIENPKAYFKFFLTKNDRYNIVQRESMNEIIRNIVTSRLTSLGLSQIRLPLGAQETEPNLPILISSTLKTCTRVIVLFYEQNQDLGIFAHRIIGGQGGINAGSAVNLVKYIQEQSSTAASEDVGIILANMGQLRWYRHGQKAVTQTSWWGIPRKSAVDEPYRFDAVKNTVPGNRNLSEHVDYIFNTVIATLVNPKAKIDIIGVSDGAFQVSGFLDGEANWVKWGISGRIEAFAAVATYFQEQDFMNPWFKDWFQKRARVYLISDKPEGAFLAGPQGGRRVTAYGCNVFSLGEPYYTENMLPKGYKTVIDWFTEVSKAGKGYENPVLESVDEDGDSDDEGLAFKQEKEDGDESISENRVEEVNKEANCKDSAEREAES